MAKRTSTYPDKALKVTELTGDGDYHSDCLKAALTDTPYPEIYDYLEILR